MLNREGLLLQADAIYAMRAHHAITLRQENHAWEKTHAAIVGAFAPLTRALLAETVPPAGIVPASVRVD